MKPKPTPSIVQKPGTTTTKTLKPGKFGGRQHDKNFNLDELCTLLKQLGFSERKGKGSHRIFRREGIEEIINLQPATDGKAKPYQVQIARGIVQAYNL